MLKKRLDESWLTEEAKRTLEPEWRYRVLLILQDIATWSQLNYAYGIGLDGARFTHTIGPGEARVNQGTYSTVTFFFLAGIVEEFLANIEYPAPAQVTIELEDEILYLASCGELYLVASFFSGVPKGYMVMKLTKRISHLRNLWRRENTGNFFGV